MKAVKVTKHFTLYMADDRYKGYFEHMEVGEDCAGGLWFENGALIDYDGVFELPKEIVEALRELGFVVGKEFE